MGHADRLFNISVDLLCVASTDGYFLELNPAFERVLGHTLEELKRKPFIEFVHPDDRPSTLAEVQKLKTGAVTLHFENRYRCKDGSYKWLQWATMPDAESGLLFAAARDVTDLKEKEQQLRQAREALQHAHDHLESLVEQRTAELRKSEDMFRQVQKLEAVGRLAGGVAHDFNNLLSVILGYSEVVLTQLSPSDPSRPSIEQIRDAGERAAALTRQLLAFSRKQVLQPEVMDLNGVVERADKMLRRLIGEDIDLVTHLTPGLDPVKVDPGQIEQIIMNLAVNARDAMPQGGKLTIETGNVELDQSYAREHVGARPGPFVLLAITDTGVGMDAETQARLFEPFFTTKELGKGTGLGLSTVYGIVKQSGGNIWVYSEPGRGTSFKVYLPRCAESVPEKSRVVKAAPARDTETVLVVEDEPGVRRFISEVLKESGYTVLATGDVDEAVALFKKSEGAIHLLLTDVVLPKMGGRQLAEALTALHPELKVLYMSGYTDNAIVHHGVLMPGTAFLEKPIKPSTLLEKVRDVLSGS